MYYDKVYDAPAFEGVFFKINKIKPTKLFAYQTLLGQVFGEDSKKSNDEETLQKCYDFILENTLFARDKDGEFKPVQLPGLDNTQLKEIEENPALIGNLVALFIQAVVKPIEKK